MATDAGLVTSGEKVIAIAGTAWGSDTALVMQAASTQHLRRLRVNPTSRRCNFQNLAFFLITILCKTA